MNISKSIFGTCKAKNVIEYVLDNSKNLKVKILNLGGIIREINFKGKNRVLGLDNVEGYINSITYFGALIGRVAGRISNGKMELNNKAYKLDQNEGSTCLHGGKEGFSFQLWELEEKEVTEDSASITLKYTSPDMECGFPGELTVHAKYTVDRDDCLTIEYFANTNKSTPLTMTNHSYFNLNNDLNQDILEHVLKIDADYYIKLDEKSIPVTIAKVENTPFDFRHNKRIKDDMDSTNEDLINTGGYDHPLILNKDNGEQIVLYSKKSGVKLSMKTTEPVVILYCGNGLNGNTLLSNGQRAFKHQGVCLETQWYPDAINQKFLPKNILKPDEKYYSKTKYRLTMTY
ncbi:galactose mutarotase [Schnuerera sp. xch1]|uniref:aldose epimerase family protein n=1 Tax=Schnuerera sp. xch1 TaxID=2874283 RepID=UPI001CBC05C7|nr:aldose epimerase family protein [Schnuerera sp. xch1]MBZ2174523.1 galactose mutarotase [Schnuerera sp. xch1]